MVAKRLAARRARIAAELEEAEAAERRWAGIREEARAVVAGAEEEAPAILRAARERAGSERAAAGAQIEGEAREIITKARETVEAEKSRVVRETANRLIQLTTETTRRYLDEMLSESERRDLMQRAILAGVDELGPEAPPGSGAT
jgi:F0F1-type ATP synthase membrane subunit b/b'